MEKLTQVMNATMKNRLTIRFVCTAAVAAAAVLNMSAAAAAPKAGTPLMNDRAAARLAELPAVARVDSGVAGTLNPAALSAPALEITLADGEKITARLQRVAKDERRATQSWVGTFDDSPGSVLVLSKAKGVVTGLVNYKDKTLELRPAKGGKHVLFAVDDARIPQGDGVHKSISAGDSLSTAGDLGTGGSTLAATGAVTHDVLVVYTAAAAATWGASPLQSMVQSAVQSANQAYQNSFVNITMNLVGMQQVSVNESGSGMQSTLNNLIQNSTVRSLRDKLAADMVVLVSEDKDWCGYASLSVSNGNADAYAVVQSACLSSQSLAHEVGHLQQIDHNRENGGNGGAYPYGYGYRVCTTNGFRDVMSYQCSTASVSRILQFSNPSVYYNGYATGISYESSPSSSAESARALNNTATTVAAYRTSTATAAPTVPTAPSSLSAPSVAYNAVSLRWTDNSGDESGFKLERATDGVNFVEIATLGAGSIAYTDGAVSARTAYYYRVRAFNSVGVSAYSNTLSLATPDVPPPPPAAPSSVAASNNGDGSALVTWVPGSSSATNYDVRREKWDSRQGTWTGATTVATVPASYTQIVDKSGSGTYRYGVRATNSGGASGYAGPVNVTVTSPKVRGKSGK